MFPLCFSTVDSESIAKEGRSYNKNSRGEYTNKSAFRRKRQAPKAQASKWGKGPVRVGKVFICIAALLEAFFWFTCVFSGIAEVKHYPYEREFHKKRLSEAENVKNSEGVVSLQYSYTLPKYLEHVEHSYLRKLHINQEKLWTIQSSTRLKSNTTPLLEHSQQEDSPFFGEGIPGPWLGVQAID